MAFDDFLNQRATIKSLVTMKDANGGRMDTWATVTANVPCLVRPISGGITREEEKDGSLATHAVMLSGSYSLAGNNQIHVDALVYNVLKCRDWNSLGHHTTVECVLETS
jgi:head-tail adaptor